MGQVCCTLQIISGIPRQVFTGIPSVVYCGTSLEKFFFLFQKDCRNLEKSHTKFHQIPQKELFEQYQQEHLEKFKKKNLEEFLEKIPAVNLGENPVESSNGTISFLPGKKTQNNSRSSKMNIMKKQDKFLKKKKQSFPYFQNFQSF